MVGVVGARLINLEDSDSVEIYLPIEAADLPSLSVLTKASVPPEDIIRSVGAIAGSIDLAVFPDVQLIKTSFRRKMLIAEYRAASVGLLGFVALLLACLGIVGSLAYAISHRTKEIGIRMALGAKPSQIVSVVLRQLSLPVAIGLLLGVGGATVLSQLLRRELYGISNLDPIAFKRRRSFRRYRRFGWAAAGETRIAY